MAVIPLFAPALPQLAPALPALGPAAVPIIVGVGVGAAAILGVKELATFIDERSSKTITTEILREKEALETRIAAISREKENKKACKAIGHMANMYQDMKIKDKHVWCGQFLRGPQSTVKQFDKGCVHHEGMPPVGSKAGVAYSSNGRHWILAWHVPFPSSTTQQNKIYVEYGYDLPVDWNLIERKLDASGGKSGCLGGIATIENGSNPAVLRAIFYAPDKNTCAIGDMANKYQDMKIKDKHEWLGQFLCGPPSNIKSLEKGLVYHEGSPLLGSKAGIAFSSNGRHWILAWHVPFASSQQNKIYVEYGVDRPVDWNVIERKLDASSRKSECSGGTATIKKESNPAVLSAIFYAPDSVTN